MGEQGQLPLPAATGTLLPVAAYVRMSTEHQQYSTENQLDRIKEYAARRGMQIDRIFADEGKSGLSVKGRESLRQMIAEVESGKAEFKAILAYDVSRWGRFQDADESGYYEYICKRAGITVHYCAEQFENDGSPTSNIIKSVKRSMAGEYSRELSTKVFQGACRLIQMGFKQGGSAGFGLRRMLIDQQGVHKGYLKLGEQKSLQTDRVVYVPGPVEEQAIVREIYHLFLDEEKNERDIAELLNARKILTDLGRPWTRSSVHQILTNEKYIGHNVYHRTSCKLKRKHVANPPEMWIRADNAFPAIVSPELFTKVQEAILARCRRYTDDELLHALKDLWNRSGRLSGLLIDEQEAMPSSAVYRHRFGSLVRAYALIGYTPEIDYSFVEINRYLRGRHPQIVQEVISRLTTMGVTVERDPATELLILEHELTVSLVLSRCLKTGTGAGRWMLRFEACYRPDLTIAVRMDETNQAIKDYYLLPALDLAEIGAKTGLSPGYVEDILGLLKNGEDRLLDAVLHGRMPVTIATRIAENTDDDAQRLLMEAYERKELTLRSVRNFRRILEIRRNYGKDYGKRQSRGGPLTTAESLVRAYRLESQRQKVMVRKAKVCEARLLSVAAAFRVLLKDEDYVNLLRAEDLHTMPKFLAERARLAG